MLILVNDAEHRFDRVLRTLAALESVNRRQGAVRVGELLQELRLELQALKDDRIIFTDKLKG